MDADNLLFTQKSFDTSDSLDIDVDNDGYDLIYFKPASQLTEEEKKVYEKG